MSEFTKGEWKVKHSETKDAFNVIGNALGGKYKIARCPYNQVRVDGQLSERYNGQEIKEAKANAQLIAHAPQLLEMLEKCLSEFQNFRSAFGQCSSLEERNQTTNPTSDNNLK